MQNGMSWVDVYAGTPSVKKYRRHRCTRKHRTWRTLANCVWSWQVWHDGAAGDGPFASVSLCNMGAGIPRYRYGASVVLFEDVKEALAAKAFIDRTGCGGLCRKAHEVIELVTNDERG